MRQLFQELAKDETATDSESPFDEITCLNEVFKSDKVGATHLKTKPTQITGWGIS